MEYDFHSVERKFYETMVPITYKHDGMSPPERVMMVVSGMTLKEDCCYVQGFEMKKDLSARGFEGFVSTQLKSATFLYPRITLEYWLPTPGIYKVKGTEAYGVLYRKKGRYFKTGLNNQAYVLASVPGWGAMNIFNIDLDAKVEPSDTIWTKDIYVDAGRLKFQNLQIGLVDDKKIYLDDPALIHILPNWVRTKWQVNS